jgi:hypothetical protein
VSMVLLLITKKLSSIHGLYISAIKFFKKKNTWFFYSISTNRPPPYNLDYKIIGYFENYLDRLWKYSKLDEIYKFLEDSSSSDFLELFNIKIKKRRLTGGFSLYKT